MRRAHTVQQVRDAEAALMATLPEGALMQRAAAGLAHAVVDLMGGAYGRRVVLLVGAGHNGGDALWAGAMLARRGVAVEAWLLAEEASADGPRAEGLAALRAAGGRVADPHDDHAADVAVDGIVGIGGRPGLRPQAEAALAHLAGVPVVAVDVPSGVDVDTGELAGPHVTASLTVTFGTLKVAHLVDPASAACGVVHLIDLGLDLPDPVVEALQPADVRRLLPRPADPVAMAIAIDPELCTNMTNCHVEIECAGVYTRGMTVVDQLNVTTQGTANVEMWRPVNEDGTTPVKVCWELDVAGWKALLEKTVRTPVEG